MLAGFACLAFLFSAAWMGSAACALHLVVERQQTWLILLSLCLAFCPLAIWFVGFVFWPEGFIYSPYLLIPAVVFPFVFSYNLQRYRIMFLDQILSRAFLYGMLAVLWLEGMHCSSVG